MACRVVLLLPVRRALEQKWCWRPPIVLSERLPVPLTWKVRKKSNALQSVTSRTSSWCSWARRMRKAVACMP